MNGSQPPAFMTSIYSPKATRHKSAASMMTTSTPLPERAELLRPASGVGLGEAAGVTAEEGVGAAVGAAVGVGEAAAELTVTVNVVT